MTFISSFLYLGILYGFLSVAIGRDIAADALLPAVDIDGQVRCAPKLAGVSRIIEHLLRIRVDAHLKRSSCRSHRDSPLAADFEPSHIAAVGVLLREQVIVNEALCALEAVNSEAREVLRSQ